MAATSEANKRRQQRGCSYASLPTVFSVATAVGDVPATIPQEATHVMVFQDSASIFLKANFDVTANQGNYITIPLRTYVTLPIPPDAGIMNFCLVSAGSVGVTLWFLGLPSGN